MKKYILFIVLLVSGFAATAQTDAEKAITAKVEALNQAIFANKDSLALESLLAKEITYGHSGGKLENRTQMINGALANKSVYENVQTDMVSIMFVGKTAIARHILTAIEKAADGKVAPLKLGILQVWVKEKKNWKLVARQAVKIA
ncbi:nuclear transport factor 2 family protein [Parasediminibacterium sp. JCM 36343]|uniref:nuclear transport factor 2 family protein n=1 Tax=Parasediminibacterium sp. JCM 36343 TaxID=3374279 RepID=UPI003978D7C3